MLSSEKYLETAGVEFCTGQFCPTPVCLSNIWFWYWKYSRQTADMFCNTNLICYIVDNDDAVGTTVIAGRYCAKPLLPCCVPLQQQNTSNCCNTRRNDDTHVHINTFIFPYSLQWTHDSRRETNTAQHVRMTVTIGALNCCRGIWIPPHHPWTVGDGMLVLKISIRMGCIRPGRIRPSR